MNDFDPYYVVIFTSIRTDIEEGYDKMDEATFAIVEKEAGFLGADSYSDDSGRHVTIAKFKSKEDIKKWKENPVHKTAQEKGKSTWYKHYNVKVCKVEREYEFNK